VSVDLLYTGGHGVAHPNYFNADPEPALDLNEDTDPAFHFNADTDLTFHFNADLNPAAFHSGGNLLLLICRSSRAPS